MCHARAWRGHPRPFPLATERRRGWPACAGHDTGESVSARAGMRAQSVLADAGPVSVASGVPRRGGRRPAIHDLPEETHDRKQFWSVPQQVVKYGPSPAATVQGANEHECAWPYPRYRVSHGCMRVRRVRCVQILPVTRSTCRGTHPLGGAGGIRSRSSCEHMQRARQVQGGCAPAFAAPKSEAVSGEPQTGFAPKKPTM
jgi:hypothetical protein